MIKFVSDDGEGAQERGFYVKRNKSSITVRPCSRALGSVGIREVA